MVPFIPKPGKDSAQQRREYPPLDPHNLFNHSTDKNSNIVHIPHFQKSTPNIFLQNLLVAERPETNRQVLNTWKRLQNRAQRLDLCFDAICGSR